MAEPGKQERDIINANIRVAGVVQGVGFRPFVYNLALSLGLTGYVLNDEEGVLISVDGSRESLGTFIRAIKGNAPPLARIESISLQYSGRKDYTDFVIKDSPMGNRTQTLISPDITTCPDCLREMAGSDDRRYRYPFINCTNCGPRFTIITGVPYDRPLTTMAGFEMCPDCEEEYIDPRDRRFHAQPIACPVCGPKVRLTDVRGADIRGDDPIPEAARLLACGGILAVKGLGGYHLACDARDDDAVTELRRRKYRYDKPFALMARDLSIAETICEISTAERDLLSSIERPIVILDTKTGNVVAEQVAPGQKSLGVMLPYTPLHTLLLDTGPELLVMTSGNRSDEPIAYEDRDAYEKLGDIADYFLTHDRPIYRRVDDSVSRIFEDREVLIRRSRGYVPSPIFLPGDDKEALLGCGAEVKNTFCITKGNKAFVSHHIGDLVNEAAFTSYRDGVEHFKELFDIEPTGVAVDMHGDYMATRYGRGLGLPVIAVQHHKAHIASVLAENEYSGNVLGVAFDGAGWGEDGAIWGGEFFIGNVSDLKRICYLDYLPQPGGDGSARAPWRMAVSYLYSVYGEDWAKTSPGKRIVEEYGDEAIAVVAMVRNGLRSPDTSSAGRLFDAVSSFLDIRDVNNYEGQAAIEMEQLADGTDASYGFEVKDATPFAIEWKGIIEGVLDDIDSNTDISTISAKFHNTVSEIIVSAAELIKLEYGIDTVALSGGVFQNMLLLRRTSRRLEEEGYRILFHKYLPPNDGCISFGQAVIAIEQIKRTGTSRNSE